MTSTGDEMREHASYETLVASRLHKSLAGLREGEGLGWLCATLRRLNETREPGLQEIVHSFLSQMSSEVKAHGFLLEIEVADSLLNTMGGSGVFGNRQEGAAQTTCDVTLMQESLRADFQCKSILNVNNEQSIQGLVTWMNHRWPELTPGFTVEVVPNKDVNDDSIVELKSLLVSFVPDLASDSQLHFVDKSGIGRVVINFEKSEESGIRVETLWSSADRIGTASAIDIDAYRDVLLNRCKQARRSFGFSPTDNQFNFVAIASPSLALMSERVIRRALYGKPFFRISRGAFSEGFDDTGLFCQGRVSYVSGVVDIRRTASGYENVIYPNQFAYECIRCFWAGKSGFSVIEPRTE